MAFVRRGLARQSCFERGLLSVLDQGRKSVHNFESPHRKMSVEVKKEIELEIAHVLFIDTVGYSKLLIDDQRTLIDTLNQIVRGTAEFQ